MNRLKIRSLTEHDYDQWLALWIGNNQGDIDEEITACTWKRLADPDNTMVNGLCAEMNGEFRGIAHYILHNTTGQIKPVCYMQDVYVDPQFRRQGVGKRLVNEITEIGKREDWARLYWITQRNNFEAKKMYENFGIKLDFTFYVLPIG